MASRALTPIQYAITEPIITGSLLFLLTQAPPRIRDQILQPFHNNLLSHNTTARLALFVTALKLLTSINLLHRLHTALNNLALNNWTPFRRPGAAFEFGPAKKELVVVTGGSSGFGYELVKSFHAHARVVALDIMPLPQELAELSDVHFYQCDISDGSALQDVCGEIKRVHGHATVLINNAGIGSGKTVLAGTNEYTERLMKVNLLSHFITIREFLPGMLEGRKGHIVSVASVASFFAAPGLVDYCVSKIGAEYLSDGIRAECLSRYAGGEGICTTSVHPFWHATGILKGQEQSLAKRNIFPDPPRNVTDLIVEQVLKGRSGKIYAPRWTSRFSWVKNWPLWLQDVALGLVWKRKKI